MKNRFSFATHFKDTFYIYLIFLVVVPVIVTYSMLAISRPSKEKTFSLFISTRYKNKDSFTTYLQETLPDVLKFNLNYGEEGDSTFYTLLNSRGTTSDVLILSKTVLSGFQYMYDYVDLTDTKYNFEPNYQRDKRVYGLATKKDDLVYLADYISYQDNDYYLIVNKNSVHLKGLREGEYKTNYVSLFLDKVFNV